MSTGCDPQADPIAELLRRAAAGDEAAKVEFYAERAARSGARARREFERTARANAWVMIRRARPGDTSAAA